jgi:hypothetical protein
MTVIGLEGVATQAPFSHVNVMQIVLLPHSLSVAHAEQSPAASQLPPRLPQSVPSAKF